MDKTILFFCHFKFSSSSCPWEHIIWLIPVLKSGGTAILWLCHPLGPTVSYFQVQWTLYPPGHAQQRKTISDKCVFYPLSHSLYMCDAYDYTDICANVRVLHPVYASAWSAPCKTSTGARLDPAVRPPLSGQIMITLSPVLLNPRSITTNAGEIRPF